MSEDLSDFSCMITIKVDIVYNQIVRETIIENPKMLGRVV